MTALWQWDWDDDPPSDLALWFWEQEAPDYYFRCDPHWIGSTNHERRWKRIQCYDPIFAVKGDADRI